jgi:hypothetical protein
MAMISFHDMHGWVWYDEGLGQAQRWKAMLHPRTGAALPVRCPNAHLRLSTTSSSFGRMPEDRWPLPGSSA